jgi:hypothetical protein
MFYRIPVQIQLEELNENSWYYPDDSISLAFIIGVRAEARRPLWNEIRFCERVTATSWAFSSVIIADHSDWYKGI